MEPAVIAEVKRLLDNLGAKLPASRQILIIPHDYPDPDALASAAALQLLLREQWKLHSRIMFSGVVSRAENRELLLHFKSKWIFPNQWRGARRNVPAILMDTAPWVGNVTLPPFVTPIAIFDHHQHSKRHIPDSLFADISPGFGALTTRLVECLAVAGIPLPKWLASIMAYAITTETFDFIRHSSPRDLEAYTSLLSRCNLKILGQIKNAALPRAYYGYLVEAVQNAATYGRVSWTHLRAVSQPEIVAEIADLLLRMERITWAFCTAFTENRLMISLRSELTYVSCARLLHQLIGKKEGSSGGHGQTAAGYVDVSGLSETEREQRRATLVNRLVSLIGGRSAETAKPLVGILPEKPAGAHDAGEATP
jgi:nanoRNase/pAp phosphatase (c-di-AMP/oligoRNAs hydrolase)